MMCLADTQPMASLCITHVNIKEEKFQKFWLFPQREQHLFSFTQMQCQSGLKTETMVHCNTPVYCEGLYLFI